MLFLPALVAAALPASPQWIWAQGVQPPAHAYFRRTVDLPSSPTAAKISITCDNAYELFVDGKEVAHSDYWYVMQSVDLRKLLHSGKNVIAVEGTNLDGPAGLLIDGSISTSMGSVPLNTGHDWKTSSLSAKGWAEVSFDDSFWTEPKIVGPLGMQPWGVPIREADLEDMPFAKPIKHEKPSAASPDVAEGDHWPRSMTGEQGHFVKLPIDPVEVEGLPDHGMPKSFTVTADFGREIAGWVEVEVEGKTSPDVKIQVGEAKTPQSPFTTGVQQVGNHTIYRLLPTGSFTGFRFAWIKFSNVDPSVKIDRVQAVWRMWPANYEGSFECSDSLLNKIWYVGAYTAHMNLDPEAFSAILRPERGDRYPWMGDDRVTHRTAMASFGDYDLIRNDLDYFVKPGQKPIAINDIPGYTLDWVIALYDYWMATGDSTEVKRHLGDLDTILDSLNVEGTPPGWLFTDWEPGLQSTTPETILAFRWKYAQAAADAATMARDNGAAEQAHKFDLLYTNMTGRIVGDPNLAGWQHALTNAILAGYKGHFPDSMPGYTATPYFTYYVVEALAEAGQDQKALDSLRSYWGGMLKLGATSTWEYFLPKWEQTVGRFQSPPEIDIPGTGPFWVSFCHPWSSGATAWLSEHVLGVTPSQSGFTECTIQPFFGHLTWAKGTVPTPRGSIAVSWTRKGKSYRISFDTPDGTATRLIVPSAKSYRLDGKRVDALKQKDGSFLFRIEKSGKHALDASS